MEDKPISRYRGVIWCKYSKKWRAVIRVNGKRQYLGRRKSKIGAAKLFDKAALQSYGEFARLNFPRGVAA